MSYMSLFERSARNSVAISLLNKMRHWLQGRVPEGLSDDERAVLKEALEVLNSPQFENIVIRNLQSVSSGLSSSILPISIALKVAISQTEDSQKITNSLGTLLSSSEAMASENVTAEVISVLNYAIQAVSDSNLRSSANPLIKSYSKGL
jgi:hypothetical protein